MDFTKIISPYGWDFGIQPVSLVKCSSRGLFGADEATLVKRGSSEFAHMVKNIELSPGDIPVHLIAMGSTELYGPNRNGDGFRAEMLAKQAYTFEKYARHYRHHKNKDPKKSYGFPKIAFYNPEMQRIELLCLLNGDTAATVKNGGFLADKELDILERGDDLPVSMACTIPYDVCAACHNKAASRKYYCKSADEGGDCSRFGCRSGLTKVAEDGFIQYVDNPLPRFFDISTVIRNADRTAFGARADYLTKAASADSSVCGAELAELLGVVPPLDLRVANVDHRVARLIKLAYTLAALEDQFDNQPATGRDHSLSLAFSPSMQPSADIEPLGDAGSHKMASGLNALASQRVLLPLRDFARLLNSEGQKSASFARQDMLPGVFNRLIASDSLTEDIKRSPYQSSSGLAPEYQRRWAKKLASTHALTRSSMSQRASLAAIRGVRPLESGHTDQTKLASAAPESGQLARDYALYQLDFLCTQAAESALTEEMVVRQNYAVT